MSGSRSARDTLTGLRAVLDVAAQQSTCTQWHCTTCGSAPFRQMVAQYLNATEPFPANALRRLATELSELPTIEVGDYDSIEFLILWTTRGLGTAELTSILGDAPAGMLYRRMLEAKARRDEARREHEKRNDPKFIEDNRSAKREAKAEAHAERLRRKAERDAEWRRKQ